MLVTDVGDEMCWRNFEMLMTVLAVFVTNILYLSTLAHPKDVTNIKILSLTPKNCHQDKVTNIHLSPTSMLPQHTNRVWEILIVLIQTMSMFYDNRVNQIREKRRVMNKIRQKLEEAETEDDIDFEAPSIYLTLKVAEIVMQNNECLVMKVI